MAISAVDCALWDPRGKYFEVPVYCLLGGPTRDRISAYGSILGHSLEPDLVSKRAREFYDMGFTSEFIKSY
jgi:L-rhamnonate dehydratase